MGSVGGVGVRRGGGGRGGGGGGGGGFVLVDFLFQLFDFVVERGPFGT